VSLAAYPPALLIGCLLTRELLIGVETTKVVDVTAHSLQTSQNNPVSVSVLYCVNIFSLSITVK